MEGIQTESARIIPVVGLGASAGGLETLEAFFSNMPADGNMAFVVVQHLSPKHKSIMDTPLQKVTSMKVLEATTAPRYRRIAST